MRLQTTLPLAFLFLSSISPLSGCDYEFKDEPQEAALEADQPEGEPEREPNKAPPAERPVLAPGTLMTSTESTPQGAKKLSILDLEALQKVTIESVAAGKDASRLFDGDDATVVRTENINPLKITLTFVEPIKLKAARMLSSYSDYNWSMTPEGGERMIIESSADGVISVLVLPNAVTTKKVTFEVLRRTRDNFCHVNEIELFE